jgi:hypothetical protein
MFWQGVADQINAGAQAITALQEMVTFGNHGDRPDPGPWPDGALYVEQDRGSVLYQNQGGIWVYIAGQMFGTLSPDQRPADLGPAADVGFAFRTSTDPARAFAWNGGQWVETTPERYGTHAERLAAPVADMVSGMLWIETDRGNAIYQNQAGTWLLLTGTMWGTLSPDQRPTDLGINDAGFTFLATTAPPRQFIWSSSAWVEITSGDVFGGAGLTHANAVTKVGAAGQIVEGGITDLSAGNSGKLNITAAGNVGIGTPNPSRLLDLSAPSPYMGLSTSSGSGQTGLIFQNTNVSGAAWMIGHNYAAGDSNCFVTRLGATGGLLLAPSGGGVGIGVSASPGFQLLLGADSAGKPTTSTWSVVSDLRLKQNIEPVKDDSLAILEKLDWIRYEYNGLASTPKGDKGIGLVAQVLREQMPEAVRSAKAKLNETDGAETDVLAIDYHHIIVHSARAIQQLSAEVKRLGALIGKPA